MSTGDGEVDHSDGEVGVEETDEEHGEQMDESVLNPTAEEFIPSSESQASDTSSEPDLGEMRRSSVSQASDEDISAGFLHDAGDRDNASQDGASDDATEIDESEIGGDSLMSNVDRPKPNMCIRCILKNGTSIRATVLSQRRQPNRKSKFKDWLNVLEEGKTKPISVKWADVIGWRELPENYHEKEIFLSAAEEMEQTVMDAKEREYRNLVDNQTFESVVDTGQTKISTRWVFTVGGKVWDVHR